MIQDVWLDAMHFVALLHTRSTNPYNETLTNFSIHQFIPWHLLFYQEMSLYSFACTRKYILFRQEIVLKTVLLGAFRLNTYNLCYKFCKWNNQQSGLHPSGMWTQNSILVNHSDTVQFRKERSHFLVSVSTCTINCDQCLIPVGNKIIHRIALMNMSIGCFSSLYSG